MEKVFFCRENERVDALGYKDLKILFSDALPKFTSDAILLAKFAGEKLSARDYVVDLGSGTGIIALMIHGVSGARVRGFEIQPALCDMSERSSGLNALGGIVDFECRDFRLAYKDYNGAFNAAVCNPPYYSTGRGKTSPDNMRGLSRSMDERGLDELCQSVVRLIVSGGRFFVCYPTEWLMDMLFALRKNSLEPKTIKFITPDNKTQPCLALTEARKGGGCGLSIRL